ncbi:MAG: methyltransferase domain-containing protein [Gemmataceae bacterium]|nr:methyltransferase domain-containing protein [Gemmataceae bacterium]
MPTTSLRFRNLQPEIMDDPSLDPDEHRRALKALARVNRISRSSRSLWPAIRELCRARTQAGDPRPVRVLDVASGGGDVPVQLWLTARSKGYALEVAGCDFSPVALGHAREFAKREQADVSFFQVNLLEGPIPSGYDVITTSLFLHHLDEEQAFTVLRKMRESAGTLALVNDLTRCRLGWLAAYFGTRLLSRCRTVHVDGPRSVEGAFKPAEALALAQRAGWDDARIRTKFPFRFLLSWTRRS